MRASWTGVLVLVALIFTSRASAFEREKSDLGVPLRWRAAIFAYEVAFDATTPEGAAFSRSARAALDVWAAVTSARIRPRYLGPAQGERARPNDGKTTIAKLSVWEARLGDRATTIAHTELFYDSATGEVREADVYLNGDAFMFAESSLDAFDPESVILHESGHALGFAHSCGDPGGAFPSCFDVPDDPPGTRSRILDAVMAPTLAAGTPRRTPNEDDRAGIEAIYAPSSTVTVPNALALGRDCPSGVIRLSGQSLPSDAELFVRFASGGTRAVSLADLASVSGDYDLIAEDPKTGAYGAILAPALPRACGASGADAGASSDAAGSMAHEGGCKCSAAPDRPGPGGRTRCPFVMLVTMALALGAARSRRTWVAPLLALACVLAPRAALAYACSRTGTNFGPSLIWTNRTIPWFISGTLGVKTVDHDLAVEEIKASFHTWEAVDCSDLSLPFQSEEQGLKAGFDAASDSNKNVVVFIPQGWPYDPGVVAVTTNNFDTRTGIIYDSDIEVNNQEFRFVVADASCDKRSGVMDLRNAITHEVGHLLGLDHPPNEPQFADDTMFASAPPCETKKRDLAQDDIDGICSIYPKAQPNHQCFLPEGPTFKVVSSNDGLGGCSAVSGETVAPILLGLFALLLVRRRCG
jgi:matrixin